MFASRPELYGPQAQPPKPLSPRQEPPLLPAAGPAALRELHRGQLAAAPAAAPALLQHLRLLPLGRRPGRRDGRSAAQPGPAGLVGDGSCATAIAARPRHPVFVALARDDPPVRHPHRPLRRPAGGLPAGPARDALRERRASCSTTAATRPIRSAGWCCTWASATRPSGRGWPTRICTGLQLANFWQDVARDWDRGRIYLPLADCRRFGYDEAMFARRECNEAFRRLMAAEVDQAEGCSASGLPLVRNHAAGAAARRGVVHPRGTGYPGGYPPTELRCLVGPARRLPSGETASGAELLVATEARDVMNLSPANLEASYAACRRLSRQAGSNFPAAFLLLPREKRRAMDALYAFMRHSDDLVDSPQPGSPAAGTL